MTSVAATKVMQCTPIRELLQSYSDYAENRHFPDTAWLRGGWRLAHLSKLHNYDRSKLIGKVHEYTIDDFIAYLQLRIAYILSTKGSSVDKLTIDYPVIFKQLHAWTVAQREALLQSADEEDFKQLCLLSQLVGQVITIREGMLRDPLFPSGLADAIVRDTAASITLALSDGSALHVILVRVEENMKRADLQNRLEKLQQMADDTLAYITEQKTEHQRTGQQAFFDAAIAKVQEVLQEAMSKDPPPAPLPGADISMTYNWSSHLAAVKKATSRVLHVRRQVSVLFIWDDVLNAPLPIQPELLVLLL
jgi:hypothetical protein